MRRALPPAVRRLLRAALVPAGLVLPLASAAADAFLLGPPPDGPTRVAMGFHLHDITAVDGEQETCSLEGVVTLTWSDPRQAFDPAELGVRERVYQGGYQFSEVYDGWWPQLVLVNQAGDFLRQGNILRIRPDGRLHYVEEVEFTAKTSMDLRSYPFDSHVCKAVFEVLGHGDDEVVLEADPEQSSSRVLESSVAEWRFLSVDTTSLERDPVHARQRREGISALVVNVAVARHPGSALRAVIAPLVLLVMLSWSVFWMDRESLGDRMDISFIGILTVVTFQILLGQSMPRIAYFTLTDVVLYISYFVLVSAVVVNLSVGWLDRRQRRAAGDRLDARCRWLFPLVYFSLLGLAVGAYTLA